MLLTSSQDTFTRDLENLSFLRLLADVEQKIGSFFNIPAVLVLDCFKYSYQDLLPVRRSLKVSSNRFQSSRIIIGACNLVCVWPWVFQKKKKKKRRFWAYRISTLATPKLSHAASQTGMGLIEQISTKPGFFFLESVCILQIVALAP